MSELFVVVEGPSEQLFVEGVLAPWLALHGIYACASRVGKPGHKGGNRYPIARLDMLNYLKQRKDTLVSCMFDFYGMQDDWPGRESANSKNHDTKPRIVERAILDDISVDFADAEHRLIPYVQMHEFEALLFTCPESLSTALGDQRAKEQFQSIRDAFATPEHINDSRETAPSKRICGVFNEYGKKYRKTFHGSLAANEIDVELIRAECPHFSEWIASLLR